MSLYDESDDYQATDDERSPLCEQLASCSEPYSDESIVGKGGMKTVSRVFCSGTQRYVARATLNDSSNPDLRDAFVREARMTAMLDHPNIIKIYEIALSDDGEPYFTMELKTGQSLAKHISDRSDRSDRSLLEIFLKVCDAVAYSHSRGILHLDLKPDNIQVGAFGEVVVCDWGLGKILDNNDEIMGHELDADMLNHCTLYGEAKGTPGYMAPEQIDNSRKTIATDIYALGAILFSLLAPMRLCGRKSNALLEETTSGVPENLYDKSVQIPSSLRAVIEKAMQKEAGDRYESVEELRSDISQYLNGYPTNAEDAGFMVQSACFWKRNRKICVVISVSLALIVSGLALFMSRLSKSEQRALDALQESKTYASALEKAILDNKDMETSLKSMPKDIVGNIFARNQQYRDYHLLMTPEISVKRSNQYLEAGLKVQTDNRYMLNALACNYFISMDFKNLKSLLNRYRNDRYRSFLTTVKGNGFQTFKEIVKLTERNNNPVYMELPIAYNAHRFRNHPEFPAVISKLIRHWYPGSGKVTLDYNGSKLVLRAPKVSKLISTPTNLSILRYLQFKELVISASSLKDAGQLAGLSMLKLDIRGTDITDLTPLLNIPTLDHLRVREGQIPRKQLDEFSEKFTIEVDRIFEGEYATYSDGARVDSYHHGYSGSGFVAGFYNDNNSNMTFSINVSKGGEQHITLRYSAGHGDADIELYVNGDKKLLTLPTTEGSWKEWSLIDIPVSLKSGKNRIRLKMQKVTVKSFNLDYLSIKEKLLAP